MLDWIGEKIFAIVTAVPALFIDEKIPNFMLFRAMVGLLFIVLIVYLIAMRPFRAAIAHGLRALSSLVVRKS